MSQQPIVCKFGGTSVASGDQIRKVAEIIDADPRRRFIVPSAPGKRSPEDTKITDLLYLAHDLARKGQAIEAVWDQIAARFLGLVAELGLDLDLQPVLDEAAAEIKGGASAAYAASRGEAINGHIVAGILDATYIDSAEVIRFGKGRRLDPLTYELIADRCSESGRYVIPGFYGADRHGTVVTFSRGGSDVTGSIVANAVDAESYENWTDVSGVLMTDPRIVPEAATIQEITYKELRELAYMGASVLHEEAVFPAREKGIPINIRNTNRPEDAGTRIVAERDPGEQVIVGIAGNAGFTTFAVEKALMNAEVGFGRRVLDVFERLGISYEHTPSGIDTMSVVVSDDNLADLADHVVEDLYSAVRPDQIEVWPGMALVATVGQGMNHRIGVAAKLFGALAEAEVNIRMIDQGSSEQNIIVGVEATDLQAAIKAIYGAFLDQA